jgi:uncharacterized membrane protein
MDLLQIVLRVVHIGAAIFWLGSATFLFVFIEPAVKELGPQGGALMQFLTDRKKMPVRIAISAMLTILAGLILYLRDSGGLDVDWITSPVGLGFTVGGVAAIAAFVLGLTMARPLVGRMGELGGAITGSGPPTPDQASEMQGIQRRLRNVSITNQILLVVALVAMVSARFL